MSSTPTGIKKSPLTAAQAIVAELIEMVPEQQSLALKFAIETLGIQLHATSSPPAADAVQPQLLRAVAPSGTHSGDIRAFTDLKAPKSDRQFTAVVAYFYLFEAAPNDRRETINADTMKEAARLAGWPQAARWSMTLTNAKNAGYLDAEGNGNFKLSSVGENLVAITLPGDAGGARIKKSSTKKRSPKRPAKRPPKKKSTRKK